MPNISVRDILRLALPPGTHIVAGANGLTRQITRAAPLRASLPAFVGLRGGEVALVSVDAAQQLDEQLTIAELVRRLTRVSVAAIVALGDLSDDDRAAAEAVEMPLLQLPDGSDLREVDREIARLLSDYDAQLERRGAQLYNLLTQRSLAGTGIPSLLDALTERTGQGVACYAGNGELRAMRARGSARIALQSLRPSPNTISVPLDTPLHQLNQQIWVEPIGAPGAGTMNGGSAPPVGYLALAGTTLDGWDTLAAQQGATALALELAKEYAVQATEDRLRGDFLSAILAGPPSDSSALIQRGNDLGYDLLQPHVALLCFIEGIDSTALGRVISALQSELNRRGIAAPLLRRESAVLCLLPVSIEAQGDSAEAGRGRGMARARDMAEALRQRLINDFPDVAFGLGTPALSLAEWHRSLSEAEQAVILGRQLFGQERLLAFSDLGVYRLLVRLRETPELWTFYRETLSKLVAYDLKQGGDNKQGGELLKTLEAYFTNLGNLAQTAKALHVHRNTLLYRLERIGHISGLNLDDPEEHFSLWLALKTHRVLRTLEE